jgi:hypothetical protein
LRVDCTILLWRESGYEPAKSKGGWQFSNVFAYWFRLTRRRVRMGLWDYTLESKPRL